MNVGIIGAGRIGRVHAQSISYQIPNATIKAVSDVRLDGVEEWAKSLASRMFMLIIIKF